MRKYVFLFLLFCISPYTFSMTCSITGPQSYEYNNGLANAAQSCVSNPGSSFTTLGPGPGSGPTATTKFRCDQSCQCPEGQSLFFDAATLNSSCTPNEGTDPDQCPEGQSKINGQCMVCLFGETDGQCNQNDPPDECAAGQTLQGYVNGNPVCNGSCEGAQSWGSVNGVEGCYGSPSCGGGNTYGSINGVAGCWPEVTCDSLGQCGDNSSSGSNTSSGSGGDTGGGSNTSSGTGGGDDGGGNNGGGSGGGANGNHGGGYVQPPGLNECPIGMYLGDDRVCRTADNNQECPLPNYHYILTNPTTGAGMCAPDFPQSSSSSPSSMQAVSSVASSQQTGGASSASGGGNNGGNNGGGSASSASSGSGSGSNTSAGAGECDPTAKNYLECISPDADLSEAEQKTADVKVMLEDQVNDGFDYIQEQYQDDVQNQVQNGVPFQDEPNAFQSALMAYFPQPPSCTNISLSFPHGYNLVLECDFFETFKLLFGWLLSVMAALYIWSMATAPVDR